MKKALLLLSVVLMLPQLLAAQYQKGGVYLSDGQTLEGYISNDTEVELKRRIYFKPTLGRTAYEVYSPQDITGFYFEGGAAYESIPTSYRRDEIIFEEKAFAKLVAEGAIDLYLSQVNIDESEFVFYARKDGRYHQLNEEEYILSPDGSGYLLRSHYQGILNALTFDCRKRIGDVRTIAFSRREIVETIDRYNACQDPDYQPLQNAYKVAKERRYFVEFIAGPIIAKRNFGGFTQNDRLIRREVFVMVGIAGQVETYKPSLSRHLLVHNSLEAYKWVAWEEAGVVDPPVLSLAYNMSAHYVFDPDAKLQIFTRIGGSFILDIGQNIIPSPGVSLGLGAYFLSGARLDLQLNAISILNTEGVTAWRVGYAIPLGRQWN